MHSWFLNDSKWCAWQVTTVQSENKSKSMFVAWQNGNARNAILPSLPCHMRARQDRDRVGGRISESIQKGLLADSAGLIRNFRICDSIYSFPSPTNNVCSLRAVRESSHKTWLMTQIARTHPNPGRWIPFAPLAEGRRGVRSVRSAGIDGTERNGGANRLGCCFPSCV